MSTFLGVYLCELEKEQLPPPNTQQQMWGVLHSGWKGKISQLATLTDHVARGGPVSPADGLEAVGAPSLTRARSPSAPAASLDL